MKLFLFIIFWMFVPTITPDGIQIGEILFNNQKIKIMKMNFTSPMWLQAGSNVRGEQECISFVSQSENAVIYSLSAIGDVVIKSIYNGEQITKKITSPTDNYVEVQSDANSKVFMYGKITILIFQTIGMSNLAELDLSKALSLSELRCPGGQLTDIDVKTNKNLRILDCSNNKLTDIKVNADIEFLDCSINQLTSIDVSDNHYLEHLNCAVNELTNLNVSAFGRLSSLNCASNETLSRITVVALNENIASSIATAITEATSVDGTVALPRGDEFYNQTIIDAAMEKGWDVQYFQ